jgi:hypothetical protein
MRESIHLFLLSSDNIFLNRILFVTKIPVKKGGIKAISQLSIFLNVDLLVGRYSNYF